MTDPPRGQGGDITSNIVPRVGTSPHLLAPPSELHHTLSAPPSGYHHSFQNKSDMPRGGSVTTPFEHHIAKT